MNALCGFIEADSGRNYYLFLRWGRVGVKGQQKLFGPWGDAQMAVDEFQVKFYEKTKNHWQNRHDFVAYPNKYTWIELDYEEDSTKKATVRNRMSSDVANLVDLFWIILI